MNKDQEQILYNIYQILSSPVFNIEYGDNKYILSNLIAKYSNCGKLYLSQKTKDKMDEVGFIYNEEMNYGTKLYGKDSFLYKKHKIRVVAEHLIPCGVILSLILESDRELGTIKEILDHNVVTIVLKEEDDTINKNKLRSKVTKDFDIVNNKWGRYEVSNIELSEDYIVNKGSIFR